MTDPNIHIDCAHCGRRHPRPYVCPEKRPPQRPVYTGQPNWSFILSKWENDVATWREAMSEKSGADSTAPKRDIGPDCDGG